MFTISFGFWIQNPFFVPKRQEKRGEAFGRQPIYVFLNSLSSLQGSSYPAGTLRVLLG